MKRNAIVLLFVAFTGAHAQKNTTDIWKSPRVDKSPSCTLTIVDAQFEYTSANTRPGLTVKNGGVRTLKFSTTLKGSVVQAGHAPAPLGVVVNGSVAPGDQAFFYATTVTGRFTPDKSGAITMTSCSKP